MTQTLDVRPLIRDMPVDERPRERLRMRGPEALTNAELIAILLRTGVNGENAVAVGQRILAKFNGLAGLHNVGFGELCNQHAMGAAKACQLLAAVELGKRIVNARPPERRVIRSPEDVFALLFADMALLEQEHLRVVLLSTRNEVLATREVYRGNVSSALVRVAEVFRDAVRDGCPSIIVVHNHPSGDPSPSAEDAALTKQLVEAGKLLGVEVLDHVIIGRNGHASLKDLKLGFS
ncbi:MAG: DNA repair protein RadC [Dehalococcoidia bacterium]